MLAVPVSSCRSTKGDDVGPWQTPESQFQLNSIAGIKHSHQKQLREISGLISAYKLQCFSEGNQYRSSSGKWKEKPWENTACWLA